ncbi:endonuclease MutS2 [Salinicoccus roseus]|uniref:Endonuclease MutS2 n=1 Tax=Salinicoccus roseus TaxID=45670 RepID=A0A0C2E403_9STAP|nr:endonuclease MutS2 [Salinicoccus roseus]KIH70132.1 recombination and DNA strand exchange inhibitor protein [Salinicoccus roseus]MDB0581456.1 endonuclease MutS2 [Salinicoccus roseus]
MNERTINTLEFNKILSQLSAFAESGKTKKAITADIVSTDLEEVLQMINEVDDASTMLRYRAVELGGITDIKRHVRRAEIGSMLGVAELNEIRTVLSRKHALNAVFNDFEEDEVMLPNLPIYINGLPDIHFLYRRITETIDESQVLDHASEALLRIRRKIKSEEGRIRDRLNDIIRGGSQKKLSDSLITMRNNRYVVPVKVEHQGEFNGIVHDMSSSGQTVYMEPMAVVQMTNQIQRLREEEQSEVERILYQLSSEVAEVSEELGMTDDALHHIDMVFAKAKYGAKIRGSKPEVMASGGIYLPAAFHPLIPGDEVVKNDIEMDEETLAVIITGPNTGGKTVTIKTIGLSVLMAQAGIPVPARDGSRLRLFEKVYSDIGDEQSIEQSLSTFSSHMTNITGILEEADDNSLVLLDELGAGTDPEEGAALAISILEYLLDKHTTVVATTHYPQLKSFSYTREDTVNASVEFDVETLSPTYRLLMGIPGKSNAFEISNKLGLDSTVIDRARKLAGRDSTDVNDMISALERHTKTAQDNERETHELLRESERLNNELKSYMNDYEAYKEKLRKEAREKANRVIKDAEAKADDIIRTLEDMKKLGADIQEHELIDQKKALSDSYQQEDIRKKERAEKIEQISPGDEVDVLSYGQKGEVIEVKDDSITVQMGIIKMKVGKDEVKRRKKEKQKRTVSRRIGKSPVKRELDLRGERYEEAIQKLDRYLDQVILSNYNEVEIIHGKGTGALQKGVQQFLKSHSKVKSFRGGMPSEGGFGVTIVEMK